MPEEATLANLSERAGFVSIWTGNFPSRDAFDRYFEEHIGEDEDAVKQPLNRFAHDIGFGYYDHDYQEADFSDQGETALAELFAPFSYSSSYLSQMAAAAAQFGIIQANTAVLLVDCHYQGETRTDSPLKFLGAFPYNKNAPPASAPA